MKALENNSWLGFELWFPLGVILWEALQCHGIMDECFYRFGTQHYSTDMSHFILMIPAHYFT